MPFTIVKGTFKPELGRPDGDSLRFVPDDPSPLFHLKQRGNPPKINRNNGSIQLRYEAIDTMESSAGELAKKATKSNLDLAGTNGGANSAPGYICSNQIGPNGRPIAFVFAGETEQADGAEIFLKPEDIDASINVQQFKLGMAYPLFYDTLFDDLREYCRDISLKAKNDKLGVWTEDATNSGASWTGNVDTLDPIYPKLWRRIDKYVSDETLFDEDRPFSNLQEYIEGRNDRISIPSQGIFTGFDNVIETTDTEVKMTVDPHDIVVIS